MLKRSTFDEIYFEVPCFRLSAPIGAADFEELGSTATDGPGFVDAKIRASNLELSRTLLAQGFRKICTQIQLRHDLSAQTGVSPQVLIGDRLHLTSAQVLSHASNFVASRFHQDPLVKREIADRLYAQWIRNSLSGKKAVAHTRANFITFSDDDGIRTIDLLSVLEKRQGIARSLLDSLLHDAREKGCIAVRVVTEAENAGALAAYRRVGFAIDGFLNVFHRYKTK